MPRIGGVVLPLCPSPGCLGVQPKPFHQFLFITYFAAVFKLQHMVAFRAGEEFVVFIARTIIAVLIVVHIEGTVREARIDYAATGHCGSIFPGFLGLIWLTGNRLNEIAAHIAGPTSEYQVWSHTQGSSVGQVSREKFYWNCRCMFSRL